MRLGGRRLDHGAAQVVLAPNAPPEIPWIRVRDVAGVHRVAVSGHAAATRRRPSAILERAGCHAVPGRAARHPVGRHRAQTAAGRGAHRRAAVLLFDEPTNDIDAPSIAAFLARCRSQPRATAWSLITTHHRADLQSLASAGCRGTAGRLVGGASDARRRDSTRQACPTGSRRSIRPRLPGAWAAGCNLPAPRTQPALRSALNRVFRRRVEAERPARHAEQEAHTEPGREGFEEGDDERQERIAEHSARLELEHRSDRA